MVTGNVDCDWLMEFCRIYIVRSLYRLGVVAWLVYSSQEDGVIRDAICTTKLLVVLFSHA